MSSSSSNTFEGGYEYIKALKIPMLNSIDYTWWAHKALQILDGKD